MVEDMSEEEEIFDAQPTSIRRVGGVEVQRIPSEWRKMKATKTFFSSDLEIVLLRRDGRFYIEIRQVRELHEE